MVWLFVTAVGFLVVTALVVGLAPTGRPRSGSGEESVARTAAGRGGGVAATGGRRCPADPCIAADGGRGAARRRHPGRVAETGARGPAAAQAPASRLSPVRRALGTLGAAAPGRLIRHWSGHLRGRGPDGRQRAGWRRGRRASGAPTADTTGFGDPPASASVPVAPSAAPQGLGGSRPDAAQRPVDMTPGAPAQDDPG